MQTSASCVFSNTHLRLQALAHSVEQLRAGRVGGLRAPIPSPTRNGAKTIGGDEPPRLIGRKPPIPNPVQRNVLRSGAHPPVWRDPQPHDVPRQLIRPGTPLHNGTGQPVGELRALVAGGHPAKMIPNDGYGERIAKFALQLVRGSALIAALRHIRS